MERKTIQRYALFRTAEQEREHRARERRERRARRLHPKPHSKTDSQREVDEEDGLDEHGGQGVEDVRVEEEDVGSDVPMVEMELEGDGATAATDELTPSPHASEQEEAVDAPAGEEVEAMRGATTQSSHGSVPVVVPRSAPPLSQPLVSRRAMRFPSRAAARKRAPTAPSQAASSAQPAPPLNSVDSGGGVDEDSEGEGPSAAVLQAAVANARVTLQHTRETARRLRDEEAQQSSHRPS